MNLHRPSLLLTGPPALMLLHPRQSCINTTIKDHIPKGEHCKVASHRSFFFCGRIGTLHILLYTTEYKQCCYLQLILTATLPPNVAGSPPPYLARARHHRLALATLNSKQTDQFRVTQEMVNVDGRLK